MVCFVGILYIESDEKPYTGQQAERIHAGRIQGSRPRRASCVLICARIRAQGRKGGRIYGGGRSGRILGAPGVLDGQRIRVKAAGSCNCECYKLVVTIMITIPL